MCVCACVSVCVCVDGGRGGACTYHLLWLLKYHDHNGLDSCIVTLSQLPQT